MRVHHALRGAALALLVAALGCSESSRIVSSQRYSQTSDSTFNVGGSAVLEIANFAGGTTVIPGTPGVIGVTAEKWASRTEHLDQIEVEMEGQSDTVRVRTTNPSQLTGVSVDLNATVPAGTRPVIQTGAGSLSYTGRPIGECFFTVGAGDITLRLPADVNVEVHLSVGAGSIQVGFPVVGRVGSRVVEGRIGNGMDGKIVAQAGTGTILLVAQ